VTFPGKAGKGDAFDGAAARCAAGQVKARPAILLGGNVGRAFLLPPGQPLFRWRGGLCLAPHPSGVSRWWNDPANVRRARRFWRAAARRP